jgi:hypothetical protein
VESASPRLLGYHPVLRKPTIPHYEDVVAGHPGCSAITQYSANRPFLTTRKSWPLRLTQAPWKLPRPLQRGGHQIAFDDRADLDRELELIEVASSLTDDRCQGLRAAHLRRLVRPVPDEVGCAYLLRDRKIAVHSSPSQRP